MVADLNMDPTESLPPERSVDNDMRDLAGGALVVFIGKLARASRGAFLVVITLLCGDTVQGLYSLGWAVSSTLNKVARFGLLRSVVYYVTEARAQPGEGRQDVHAALAAGLWIAVAASSVVVVGTYIAADSIAAFYDKPIGQALRIMAWTAPFIALSWVFTSATRALRIMRYEVYVRSVVGPLVLLVGGAAVGLAGFGLEAIAWVQLFMTVGTLGLSVVFFRRHFSLGDTFAAMWHRSPWWIMARFSLPVMLTDMVYALLVQLDVLMLGWYVEASTVAVYVLARRLASIVLKAPQAFDAIFSSVVTELSAQKRHGELATRFVTVSRWILTVNLPIAVCLLLVGDSMLQLLGSSRLEVAADLELAIEVLFVLGVGMMIQSVFAVAEPLLAMSGRPGLNFANNIVWLAVNAGLNLWLIELYGAVGAAFGATLAMLLINLMRIVEVYAFRRIMPFHRSQLKPLLAGAVAAVPTWLLLDIVTDPQWRAILSCVGFLPAYVGMLILLRPEAEDKLLLGQFWQATKHRLGR